MRRFIRLTTAFAALTGVVTLSSATVHAAPGDITTVSITPPAALAGLTGSAVASARDGGLYYAYASGDDYKVFKTKPDGTQDTTFGVSGIATVTGLSGSKRLLITSDLGGKWWALVSPNVPSASPKISVGEATGNPTASWTISYSDMQTNCAAAYPTLSPTTWSANNARVVIRRGGGHWLQTTCTGTGTVSTGSNLGVLAAYTNAGVRDTSVPLVGFNNALSSSGQCFFTSVIPDPTAPTSAPELLIVRTEHTLTANGQCSANPMGLTAAHVTGYSLVSVASTGATTTKLIPSNGDASDGILSGRIDPGGRIVTFNANLADTSTISIRRIKTDGTLDTTVGTAGVRSLSIGAAPAGQNSVNASAMGIITTPTKVYFAVLLSDSTAASSQCQSTAPFTWGYRYAVVSPTDGILSSYGTNGVGARTFVTAPENTPCTTNVSGGASVDTDGQSRIVRFDNGATKLDVWAAPTDANGGGDGGTGSGGATTDTGGAPSKGDGLSVLNPSKSTGRVDSTVYSKRLPARITSNTAIQVLTSAQVTTQVLVSRTPEVCIPLSTKIVVIGQGTCTVRVLNKTDRRTLRTLTSKATSTDTSVGTSIVASEPIQFSVVSFKLSAAAKAQLEKMLDQAKSASRILIVGHSGMLYDTEAFNVNISIRRTAAVKSALQKAGVNTPLNLVGLGSKVPLTTKKTEAVQAKNRRVVLYFFP